MKHSFKKILSLALSLMMVLTALVTVPFGTAATEVTATENWSADENGVYYIGSAADLMAFSANCTGDGSWTYSEGNYYYGATVKLTADIDMTGVTNWTPVICFYGNFDGQGHTITGLNVTASANNGSSFIKILGGSIANVTFANCAYQPATAGAQKWQGVVAGHVMSAASVNFENVTVINSTAANESGIYIGGIAGRVDVKTSFTNCVVMNTTVKAESYAGGFVGYVANSSAVLTFTNCYSNTTVTTSGSNVGGFIGSSNGKVTYTSCVNNSQITSTGGHCGGGFFGLDVHDAETVMTDCLSMGSVSVTNGHAAGIVGKLVGELSMTRCISMVTTNDGAAKNGVLMSMYSERASSWDKANPALTADPNADVSAYVNDVVLVDCYVIDSNGTDPTMWLHVNRYFSCFKYAIGYTNANGTVEYASFDGMENGCRSAAYTADQVNAICAMVKTIDGTFDFANYPAFTNWCTTGDTTTYKDVASNSNVTLPVVMPATVAKLLGKCPIKAEFNYQVATTENADGTINIRFIAVVNDLRYANVGFNVQATRDNGVDAAETSAVVPVTATGVYKTITALGSEVTAESLGGKYIIAVVINNIDYKTYSHTFEISAFVTMQDGTVLTTETKSATLAKKGA